MSNFLLERSFKWNLERREDTEDYFFLIVNYYKKLKSLKKHKVMTIVIY